MEETLISIHIAGKEFSLKADKRQEEKLRQAAKALNERIADRRQRFGLGDKLDLLAMVAFDMAVEKIEEDRTDDQWAERIERMADQVSAATAPPETEED